MELFQSDCENLDAYLDKETVIAINRFVTETGKERRKAEEQDDVDSHGFDSFISVFDTKEFDFSREEDYHQVINEGILGNLFENILFMECRENPDILHLAAFIIKTLAESQVFADGNKRTAYIAGSAFLMSYQRHQGIESPVVPYLSDDFVSILQDIAVGNESLEFLEQYLSSLKKPLREKYQTSTG